MVSDLLLYGVGISFVISLVAFLIVRYKYGSYEDALKRKNVLISKKYWVAYFVILAAGTTLALFLSEGMRTGDDIFDILISGYAGFALGFYFYLTGFHEYRKYSLVRNIPTSKIRSVAAGTAEIEGNVLGTEEEVETGNKKILTSPFSDDDCVFYKYEIEKYVESGDDSHWETVDTGRSEERFYIDDGTGKILVDPRDAEVRIPSRNRIRVNEKENPPEDVIEFVNRNFDTDSDALIFDGPEVLPGDHDMKYTEYYLAPDQHVYVLGKAVPRSKSSPRNPENLVMTKSKELPMLISDSHEEEFKENLQGSYYLRLLGGGGVAVIGYAVVLWVLKVI